MVKFAKKKNVGAKPSPLAPPPHRLRRLCNIPRARKIHKATQKTVDGLDHPPPSPQPAKKIFSTLLLIHHSINSLKCDILM